MAEEKEILLRLTFDTVQAVKNQAELKKLLKETNIELSNAAIGSEEYKKLETTQGLLQNRLKGLQTATKQATSELNVQKGSLRDLQAQYTNLTRSLREAAPGTEVLGMSFEEAKKKAFDLKEEIKTFEAELGNTTPNVGNYGDALKQAGISTDAFGLSLDGLFKLMMANPILAIITLLFLFGKALMSNDTIATAFKGVMTGLGIAIDKVSGFLASMALKLSDSGEETSKFGQVVKEVFIRTLNAALAGLNYFIALIEAAGQAIDGDFSKAMDTAGTATKQFGKDITFMNDEMPEFVENIISATKVGIEYEKALDAIEAKQSLLNVKEQELINTRDRLKLQSQDLAKSEEERIALNEKAVAIDKQILNQRLGLIDEEIAAQKKYVAALGNDTVKREEAEFRLNDLQVERLKAINESLKFEEAAQNKRNKIIEKQLADQEKLAKEEEENRKKREKEEAELAKRVKDSDNKLEQFRLDLAAKRATDINEKLKAQLAAEDFRVKVLLDNEKLLASERQFILSDSEAKILDLKIAADKARLEQDKKTEAERVAFIQQSNQQIQDYTSQAADIARTINQNNLNNQLYDLEQAKNRELQLAGNNTAKKEKIEEKFAKRREEIERGAAKRANAIALVQAIINTALAVTKALSVLPPPASFISASLQGAAGTAQVATILSEDRKLEDGGIIKNFGKRVKDYGKAAFGKIIGGKPHSMGGTKFYGEDGTRFEAEKGELIAVVNKRDTPLLQQLSAVNSIHGKPYFRDGGVYSSHLVDGGFALRASTAPVENSISTRNDIIDIVSSMPNPIVLVSDINNGQERNVKVSSRADI
jgi:hypothetical protein